MFGELKWAPDSEDYPSAVASSVRVSDIQADGFLYELQVKRFKECFCVSVAARGDSCRLPTTTTTTAAQRRDGSSREATAAARKQRTTP